MSYQWPGNNFSIYTGEPQTPNAQLWEVRTRNLLNENIEKKEKSKKCIDACRAGHLGFAVLQCSTKSSNTYIPSVLYAFIHTQSLVYKYWYIVHAGWVTYARHYLFPPFSWLMVATGEHMTGHMLASMFSEHMTQKKYDKKTDNLWKSKKIANFHFFNEQMGCFTILLVDVKHYQQIGFHMIKVTSLV